MICGGSDIPGPRKTVYLERADSVCLAIVLAPGPRTWRVVMLSQIAVPAGSHQRCVVNESEEYHPDREASQFLTRCLR